MDPSFQAGEIITAHIPDLTVKRVLIDDDDMPWVYVTYGEDMVDLALPVGTSIQFERVTPADGEPQPGELWRDAIGNLFVARKSHDGTELINVDDQSSPVSWKAVHQGMYGPIDRAAARPHPMSTAPGAVS